MASHQPIITEFLAKSRQARPHYVGISVDAVEKDSGEICVDIELSVPPQVSGTCTQSFVFFYSARVESGSAVIEDRAEDGPPWSQL